MNKTIFLVKGTKVESYSAFAERIFRACQSLVKEKHEAKVKVVYTKEPPPKVSIIPFKKKKVAAISVYSSSENLNFELEKAEGFCGKYVVEEAIPVAYSKQWKDNEETPGICLFTLFKKRKDLSFETFLDRWHNSHTPLSLEIHPLWNYNRNVVRQKETIANKEWDGIVEEQFRTKADLLNPIKFFGNPLIMPYRMWQVYSDTKRFLDYKTIEPYFAAELHLKS
jgi:hypothetical protein